MIFTQLVLYLALQIRITLKNFTARLTSGIKFYIIFVDKIYYKYKVWAAVEGWKDLLRGQAMSEETLTKAITPQPQDSSKNSCRKRGTGH